ncbi:hypothetical protein [Colwellia sp. BRX9-1]|jgi:hypothetical protein|uniref:hypothetical protein n=1 Tax=Colwellia sp. BRX9-1 TaxID=2759830 RepID=UPI0015F516DF|nr:hypothetical protein [Colwellia sp. BRX9-1]MBA6354214.1 hypothetical protein [Colwellia sp. BRX9-1]
MKYLVVVIIVGYIFLGLFPQKGLPSDVDSIVIEKYISGKKDPVSSVILNYGEATLLSKDIGYLWCNYFMLNSWEEMPHYWLTVNSGGITKEKIFVSRSEFSTGCKSSDKVVAQLEQRLF